jgi:CBS domain-containing protein
MRVGDLPGLIADRDLAAVNDELTVLDAAEVMTDRHIGAVIALCEGRMSGIFTERDLMTRVVVPGLDVRTTCVADVMSRTVATVTVDEPVETCLSRMREGGFRHLPVVDAEGEPFAMLSQRDFLTRDGESAALAFGTAG